MLEKPSLPSLSALPHEIPEHALRVGHGESLLLDQCRRQDPRNSHGQASALTRCGWSRVEHQGNQELLRRHRNGLTVLLRGGHICLSALPFLHVLLLFRGGGVSHGYHRELTPFRAARAARLFNSACAQAVFATVGRVRCSQCVGAGTFVGEGMNTLRPTGLATRNEAPVGTMLGGLGASGVSKRHCHLIARQSPGD